MLPKRSQLRAIEETLMATLDGMKVAILAAEGFEQAELLEPRKALDAAGAQTRIVSPAKGEVQGWKHFDKGEKVRVDVPLEQAKPDDFDALLLPGGVANPDQLRMNPKAVEFVRAFFQAGKPVAAICHAPWTLIEAGVVQGRTVTSWPSLKTDLTNAGARWVDEEVVTDNGLVTSRKPDDIPAFNRKMIEEFAEGRHEPQATSRFTPTGKEQRRPNA
jgi:protease I